MSIPTLIKLSPRNTIRAVWDPGLSQNSLAVYAGPGPGYVWFTLFGRQFCGLGAWLVWPRKNARKFWADPRWTVRQWLAQCSIGVTTNGNCPRRPIVTH